MLRPDPRSRASNEESSSPTNPFQIVWQGTLGARSRRASASHHGDGGDGGGIIKPVPLDASFDLPPPSRMRIVGAVCPEVAVVCEPGDTWRCCNMPAELVTDPRRTATDDGFIFLARPSPRKTFYCIGAPSSFTLRVRPVEECFLRPTSKVSHRRRGLCPEATSPPIVNSVA